MLVRPMARFVWWRKLFAVASRMFLLNLAGVFAPCRVNVRRSRRLRVAFRVVRLKFRVFSRRTRLSIVRRIRWFVLMIILILMRVLSMCRTLVNRLA